MMAHDTFPDHDTLPATTTHAALSAEVVRLRQEIAALKDGHALLQDELLRCRHKKVQCADALQAERDMHERTGIEAKRWEVEHYDDVEHITQIERLEEATRGERDAARQALRNLVDATSWYGDEKSGHIAVNEGAMNVAMGLVVAWSREW